MPQPHIKIAKDMSWSQEIHIAMLNQEDRPWCAPRDAYLKTGLTRSFTSCQRLLGKLKHRQRDSRATSSSFNYRSNHDSYIGIIHVQSFRESHHSHWRTYRTVSVPTLHSTRKKCISTNLETYPCRGFGTSIELAKHGARVYIASRSAHKVQAAIQAIVAECPDADVHFLRLDLADLAGVVEAARDFTRYDFFPNNVSGLPVMIHCLKRRETSLHLLINNAGVSRLAAFPRFWSEGGNRSCLWWK